MIAWLKSKYRYYNLREFRRSPILWFYAAYLSLRYIDQSTQFPAIKFKSYVKVRIKKGSGSVFIVKERLIFEPFICGRGVSTFNLANHSKFIVDGEFLVGDGVKFLISNSGVLKVGGKDRESGSGITANSTVMVKKKLEIGKDCIIAWDTFLTDCDWHTIESKEPFLATSIGDHVWIGVGAKILKGATIGRNSIVTSNTVVLTGDYPDSSLISGNPGKVVKSNILDWRR
jgi:acetyltransferase-like isoleucine patch superfamily enzyme